MLAIMHFCALLALGRAMPAVDGHLRNHRFTENVTKEHSVELGKADLDITAVKPHEPHVDHETEKVNEEREEILEEHEAPTHVSDAAAVKPHEPHVDHETEKVNEEREEILEEHEAPTHVSDAVAFMLLGMVAFQMSLFYLVNFPDDDIQQFTWWALSQTISIFCAVTIWHAIKSTVEFMMGEAESDNPLGIGVPMKTEIHLLMLFLFLFVAAQGTLARMWKDTVGVSAFGIIAAHTLGFSAVDAFGEIVQMHPWNDSSSALLIGTVIIGAILFCLVQLSTYVRKMRSVNFYENDEDAEMVTKYMEVCEDFENEFAGFVLGLIITQAIIFSITSRMPPIEGFPFKKTMPEVLALLFSALGAMILLIVFIHFVRKVYKDRERSPAVSRVIAIVEMTISMTIGWCLLFAGRWFFWVHTGDHGVGEGDQMSARVVQALAFSFVSFAAIFVIDFFADRGFLDTSALRSLMSAMGLLLGLAWEGAFGAAVEDVGRGYEEHPTAHLEMMDGLGICLCVIVLPAWAMFILPAALKEGKPGEEEEEANKGQQLVR